MAGFGVWCGGREEPGAVCQVEDQLLGIGPDGIEWSYAWVLPEGSLPGALDRMYADMHWKKYGERVGPYADVPVDLDVLTPQVKRDVLDGFAADLEARRPPRRVSLPSSPPGPDTADGEWVWTDDYSRVGGCGVHSGLRLNRLPHLNLNRYGYLESEVTRAVAHAARTIGDQVRQSGVKPKLGLLPSRHPTGQRRGLDRPRGGPGLGGRRR